MRAFYAPFEGTTATGEGVPLSAGRPSRGEAMVALQDVLWTKNDVRRIDAVSRVPRHAQGCIQSIDRRPRPRLTFERSDTLARGPASDSGRGAIARDLHQLFSGHKHWIGR